LNKKAIDQLFYQAFASTPIKIETFEKFLSKNADTFSENFKSSFISSLKIQDNQMIESLLEKTKIKVDSWECIFNYCKNENLELKTLQKLIEGNDFKEDFIGTMHQVKNQQKIFKKIF
jgi:hypothetical protein